MSSRNQLVFSYFRSERMQTRIFVFHLFLCGTALVSCEPGIIDSLTFQLPDYDNAESAYTHSRLSSDSPSKITTETSPSSTDTQSTTATPTTSMTPTTELRTMQSRQAPVPQQSTGSSGCPQVVCFIAMFANSSSLFDCAPSPPVDALSIHRLECTFWQPPASAQVPSTDEIFSGEARRPPSSSSNNHLPVLLRIVLKPSVNSQLDVKQRVVADAMVPGALVRLVKAVRSTLDPSHTTQLKLSLIMVKMKRLSYIDLARVFAVANIGGLTLWNPDELEETSFLQHAQRINGVTGPFVRLTFYCEADNDQPAFGRLWLPWFRWQVTFRQCRGHYSCYRWPRGDRLCCNLERCPEVPGYVVTHGDKLANRDASETQIRQQQVLDFYSCSTETDLTGPLVDLKKRDGCWAIPGYGKLDTTLEPPSSHSTTASSIPLAITTTTTSTTTNSPATGPQLSVKETASEGISESETRVRNLVIGVVCLLVINLVTFACFLVACCWAWKKLGDAESRQRFKESTVGSFLPNDSMEKTGNLLVDFLPLRHHLVCTVFSLCLACHRFERFLRS